MTEASDPIQVNVTLLSGDSRTIQGEIGTSLMEVIRGSGIDDIPAYCGGNCSCASCHVYVDAAFVPVLPAMSQDEDDLLDSAERRATGSRLSCQIPASPAIDGIRLTIAPQE